MITFLSQSIRFRARTYESTPCIVRPGRIFLLAALRTPPSEMGCIHVRSPYFIWFALLVQQERKRAKHWLAYTIGWTILEEKTFGSFLHTFSLSCSDDQTNRRERKITLHILSLPGLDQGLVAGRLLGGLGREEAENFARLVREKNEKIHVSPPRSFSFVRKTFAWFTFRFFLLSSLVLFFPAEDWLWPGSGSIFFSPHSFLCFFFFSGKGSG